MQVRAYQGTAPGGAGPEAAGAGTFRWPLAPRHAVGFALLAAVAAAAMPTGEPTDSTLARHVARLEDKAPVACPGGNGFQPGAPCWAVGAYVAQAAVFSDGDKVGIQRHYRLRVTDGRGRLALAAADPVSSGHGSGKPAAWADPADRRALALAR